MEALLEETIAHQRTKVDLLKEFYLLYYLDLANEKASLRQIDLPDKLHLSPSAVSRMVARTEEKKLCFT